MNERILPDWTKHDQGKVIWLDDNHAITWSISKGDQEPSGGVLWHRLQGNVWCYGAFFLRSEVTTQLWTLVSKEPLTLSPSFLCHCGHHGFIKGGSWVSA